MDTVAAPTLLFAKNAPSVQGKKTGTYYWLLKFIPTATLPIPRASGRSNIRQ